MSYALSMDWILHIAPGVPAPAHRKMKFDSSINCQKGASYVQKYASYNLELSLSCRLSPSRRRGICNHLEQNLQNPLIGCVDDVDYFIKRTRRLDESEGIILARAGAPNPFVELITFLMSAVIETGTRLNFPSSVSAMVRFGGSCV